ncbi:hypothetical protein BC941DRAFT_413737 [Chlamydoabsidia padenii]|nr:hypothetical protein BC941DRAFT_413737 [Chlamydoabsidia padenii]
MIPFFKSHSIRNKMVTKKRKVVLHYHDIMLEETDMATLEEGQWLNDNIMSFYMEYIERQVIPGDSNDMLLLRPTMSQLIAHTPGNPKDLIGVLPPHLDKRRLIFVPINNGTPETANNGTHWALLVYSRPTNTFYYYDSLHSTNIEEGRNTSKRMISLFGTGKTLLSKVKPPDFIPLSTPQQSNGTDCGLMVIGIMDCLIHQTMKCSTDDALQIGNPNQVRPPNETRSLLKSLIRQEQRKSKQCRPLGVDVT